MSLKKLDTISRELKAVKALEGFSVMVQPFVLDKEDHLALLASSPSQPSQVLYYDGDVEALKTLSKMIDVEIHPDDLSYPETVSWPIHTNQSCHGLFMTPKHFSGDRPPVIVRIHGGPTAQVFSGWDLEAQFFTSHGYAVMSVNYRGSFGYGKNYTKSLYGDWGHYDVEDACSAVFYLAEKGLVDPKRAVIYGASAGGYTVLQTMIHRPEVFAAGICLYGVADLIALAEETHKFEKHYTDVLLGPLPECQGLYRKRSPIHHMNKIQKPLALFQGEEDRVVPKSQTERMVEALRESQSAFMHRIYPEEGHGFRKPETRQDLFESVLCFLNESL